MKEKQDLRIIKSLQSIQDSFFQCVKEKPFSKITINDITRTAMINKTTFYNYYLDKYDLRKKIVDEVLEDFQRNINVSFIYMDSSNVAAYAENLKAPLLFIYKNRNKYLALWQPHMEYDVFLHMQTAFETTMRNHLLSREISSENGLLSPENELFVRLFAGNCMCTIRWWLEYCPEIPVEKVARIITDCLSHGEISAFNLLI
jgi:AcrR family transcriptional regulator